MTFQPRFYLRSQFNVSPLLLLLFVTLFLHWQIFDQNSQLLLQQVFLGTEPLWIICSGMESVQGWSRKIVILYNSAVHSRNIKNWTMDKKDVLDDSWTSYRKCFHGQFIMYCRWWTQWTFFEIFFCSNLVVVKHLTKILHWFQCH